MGTRWSKVRVVAGVALIAAACACSGSGGQGRGDTVDDSMVVDVDSSDSTMLTDALSVDVPAPPPPDDGRPDLGSDAAEPLVDIPEANPADPAADALEADAPPPGDVVPELPGLPDVAEPDVKGPDVTEPDVPGSDVADPWPVPELDPEPAMPCPEANDDPYTFQFLDDVCHAKAWPTVVDRDFACPVLDLSADVVRADGSTVTFAGADAPVVIDATALAGLDLPAGLKVVLLEIVRVDGAPRFRYVSNGTEDEAVQPWSSTKFLAVANAAARLRIASDYEVGLTASVGGVPVGDYVTSIHTYDDEPYSSNSLAAWFHDVGLHQRANDLIHEAWLDRPADETFGGNYGEAPAPLPFTFEEAGGASVTLTPDPGSGPANHLSVLTLAEALKRLVLHREVASQRLPGIQWLDVKTLLYGAAGSATYGDWGGMTADTAIYLQAAHDLSYLAARSQGRWRIFSKLGLGSQGQFVHVGYACWPVLDADGAPVPGKGREVVVAAQLATGGASWAERDRLLARAYRTLMIRLVESWL